MWELLIMSIYDNYNTKCNEKMMYSLHVLQGEGIWGLLLWLLLFVCLFVCLNHAGLEPGWPAWQTETLTISPPPALVAYVYKPILKLVILHVVKFLDKLLWMWLPPYVCPERTRYSSVLIYYSIVSIRKWNMFKPSFPCFIPHTVQGTNHLIFVERGGGNGKIFPPSKQ